jgi:hypothetical protein
LTFRTSKKHKSQESTKASRNALKLASRFQRFLNTGVSSKKDLKDVDERLSLQVKQQGDKILTLLDQLKDVATKGAGQGQLEQAFESWVKWISSLDSKDNLGYSSLKSTDGVKDDTLGILLEGVVDAETHLFQMLFAYKSSLSYAIKNPDALDAKSSHEFFESGCEIIETYQSRQRMLGKIVNSKR